jgi:hypothetical protein
MYNNTISNLHNPRQQPSAPEMPHSQHSNNPFVSPTDTLPLHLLDLDTPVPAPYYPVINANGQLDYQSYAKPSWAVNWPPALPVAPTIQAAFNYNKAQGHDQPIASVERFIHSNKFSPAQKAGIEAFYAKHHISIGVAHQLEALADYRLEFMLDDHKDTNPHEFEFLKKEICKRVELLRHVPNSGITIRSFSEYKNPRTFHIQDENHSEQIFFNIRNDLVQRAQSKHSDNFQEVYQTAVGDAAQSGIKTILYVFSGRDLTRAKNPHSSLVRGIAKDLTKAVVNRPVNLVPTAFYPCSKNRTSNQIFNTLDTIAKRVGVISPFHEELAQITQQQSKRFPFNEGYHIQASLLSPVSQFWDEIDEGRLFSKTELENHLGTTIKPADYDSYFNEALDLQAALFQTNENQAGSSQASKKASSMPKTPFQFETNTQSPNVQKVPTLLEQIELYRQNPAWTDEVEDGINRLCSENQIPIGLGLHMFQVVEKHHEFNIDNSYSMGYRADQSDEQNRPLVDSRGVCHQSRMQELKSVLTTAASLLSYLPTKGVTISTFYNNNRSENHPQWTLNTTGKNRESFLQDFRTIINPIEPSGNTPLNRAAQNIYERANRRSEKTNVIFFTDGQPNDQSAAVQDNHRAPFGSMVSSKPIREFIKRLVNRDAEQMPVTIAQTTNNPTAVAWTNLSDQVCYKTNAIDDKNSEVAEVRAHHGQSFPYNDKTYALALLLGNDNPLFDGLDENGIFSKVELETLYGRPINDKDYDRYFDEAYALQCAPNTESIKSTSVEQYTDWAKHASTFKTPHRVHAGSSSGFRQLGRTSVQIQTPVVSSSTPLLSMPEAPSQHNETAYIPAKKKSWQAPFKLFGKK